MFWSRCDVTTDYIPGARLKVEEGEGWAGVGNVLQQVGQLSVSVQLSNKVLPVARSTRLNVLYYTYAEISNGESLRSSCSQFFHDNFSMYTL
jgi:hypothetical protein